MTEAQRIIAESLDWPSAERLTPNLVWMAEHVAAHGEPQLSESLPEQLGQISISTVRQRPTILDQDQSRLPRRRPSATHDILRQVPMRRIPLDEHEPGHLEVDLVHHLLC